MQRVSTRPSARRRGRRRRQLGRGEELTEPALVVCADWSKDPRQRAAWAADLEERALFPLEPRAAWTAQALLAEADELRGEGSALVAFDAPLGVPGSFLRATGRASFFDWLVHVDPAGWAPVLDPADWSVDRPFFRVAAGEGGKRRFEEAAARHGVVLRRAIEVQTRANSVFAFGLPGQVGPAAQALWVELREAMRSAPRFVLWPFEEPALDAAIQAGICVAEMYPRAAYGVALSASLPARPRSLAKTKRRVRDTCVSELEQAAWVAERRVRILGSERARGDANEFDALLAAAAVLRLGLAGLPLASPDSIDPCAEGGILCV